MKKPGLEMAVFSSGVFAQAETAGAGSTARVATVGITMQC